jgi:hypothetical protein
MIVELICLSFSLERRVLRSNGFAFYTPKASST